jgi:hypothetical protein
MLKLQLLFAFLVPVDGPTSIDEAKQHLYEYTFLRKLSTAFPHDFAQHLKNIGKDKKIFPQRNEDDLLRAAMGTDILTLSFTISHFSQLYRIPSHY